MIELDITNQKLEIVDTKYLVNKSHNYLKIKFNFNTSDWIDRTKFCLLQNNERVTYQFLIENGKVIIPSSVLKGKYFKISVYGVAEDNSRITTNQIRMKLAESGYTDEISPVDDVGRDVFIVIFEILETKLSFDDIDLAFDVESFNPIANSVVANALNLKSDIRHHHTANEVSGIDEIAGVEIKRAYTLLGNKIRNYE